MRFSTLARQRWLPMWLRKHFAGRYTQAEIDRINQRAAENFEAFKKYIDSDEE